MYIEHMHTWKNLGEKYILKSLIQLFSSQNKRQLDMYARIQFSASSIIYETKFTPIFFAIFPRVNLGLAFVQYETC